jgi:UDP-N-acetylmuramoylalanine--D-glutamate ligase
MSLPTPSRLDLTALRTAQRALVVGMGRSGQEATRLLQKIGVADISCTDLNPNAVLLPGTTAIYGEHRRPDFTKTDLVVVSPGVPGDMSHIEAAEAQGVPVVGELGLAAAVLQSANLPGGPLPMVGITGTNGKSSTCWLLGQLLTQSGKRPFVGGNLGSPLSLAAMARLDGDLRHECAVVEVSSYQLERPGPFHPVSATVMNLTPDHLARHGDMNTYASTKLTIFLRMGPTDRALLPASHPWLPRTAMSWKRQAPPVLALGAAPGVRVEGENIIFEGTDDDGVLSIAGYPMPGTHNRLNLATALLLAQPLGLVRDRIDVASLRSLPHRMQPIPTTDGRIWINDSKATNVDAACAGIDGIRPGAVILLGGAGKVDADYRLLAGPLRRAALVICFGKSGPEISHTLMAELADTPVIGVAALADATALARDRSQKGSVIVLCPACASFDEFDNYEHRGRVFADLARGEST